MPDGRTDGLTDRQMDGRVDRQTDGLMDGWVGVVSGAGQMILPAPSYLCIPLLQHAMVGEHPVQWY